MSYYTVELENDVRISANQLNENLLNCIKDNLILNYEGKISILTNSYIIKILSFVNNIDNGRVEDLDGSVTYKIKYTAIVFKPENVEVDITVTKCNDVGLWGYPTLIGNSNVKIECVLPKDIIGIRYTFINGKWICKSDPKKQIENDSQIKVKIMNFVIEVNKINMIGTLNF